MKTKGALIWEFNQPWAIEDIEIGDPQAHEVKIQMEAAGMCHSDHHLVTGGIPMAGFPVLGGHEGAGIVTEVGPGVEDLAPGDHVVLSFIPSCGTCPTCQAGMRNLCDLGAGLLGGQAVSDGTVRTADIRPGQDVAIVGVGGVGMAALQGAANAGARYIFAIDPVEWKRDQALKFGATHVYP